MTLLPVEDTVVAHQDVTIAIAKRCVDAVRFACEFAVQQEPGVWAVVFADKVLSRGARIVKFAEQFFDPELPGIPRLTKPRHTAVWQLSLCDQKITVD